MDNNLGWKHTWHVLIPILAYTGITYLVEFLGTLVIVAKRMIENNGVLPSDPNVMADQVLKILTQYAYELNVAACLLALPLMIYFIRSDIKRLGSQRKIYDHVEAYYYLPLIVLGMAGCLFLNNMINISGLAGNYQENLNQVKEALYQGRLILELVGIGIISPIVEELLFRGIVMNRMEEMGTTTHAIVLSSILFGCYHGNFLQMVYATMLGLLMGYSYSRYRSLLAPILIHIGANMVSVIGSETTLLDGLYVTEPIMMIGTGVWCLLILGCCYIISNRVEAKELTKAE